MAKILGLGGIFFKSANPARLAAWYHRWLAMPIDPEDASTGASFQPSALPKAAFSVWSPFKATTKYFAPSTLNFMFNLIVDDVDGALAQVADGGAEIVGDVEKGEYGTFGWFIDPDGNKVELWTPPVGQ